MQDLGVRVVSVRVGFAWSVAPIEFKLGVSCVAISSINVSSADQNLVGRWLFRIRSYYEYLSSHKAVINQSVAFGCTLTLRSKN